MSCRSCFQADHRKQVLVLPDNKNPSQSAQFESISLTGLFEVLGQLFRVIAPVHWDSSSISYQGTQYSTTCPSCKSHGDRWTKLFFFVNVRNFPTSKVSKVPNHLNVLHCWKLWTAHATLMQHLCIPTSRKFLDRMHNFSVMCIESTTLSARVP